MTLGAASGDSIVAYMKFNAYVTRIHKSTPLALINISLMLVTISRMLFAGNCLSGGHILMSFPETKLVIT